MQSLVTLFAHTHLNRKGAECVGPGGGGELCLYLMKLQGDVGSAVQPRKEYHNLSLRAMVPLGADRFGMGM